jgi:hypothetical protein
MAKKPKKKVTPKRSPRKNVIDRAAGGIPKRIKKRTR